MQASPRRRAPTNNRSRTTGTASTREASLRGGLQQQGSGAAASPVPEGSATRGRGILVIAIAAVLVVVVALVIGLIAGSDKESAQVGGGSLASAVTGATDQLTAADIGGSPSMSAAPGRQEPSRQQWEELLPKLQSIVEASPDDVNALRKLALAHYNLGQFSDALDVYDRLLAIKEDAVLRNRLGNTLRDMGEVAAAETAYRKAISDDAALAAPYINLAELLWRQGKDSAALGILDQGVEAVPEDSRQALQKARKVLSSQQGGDT